MIKKALIFAVTAASLATGASAFAQSEYRTDGYERYQYSDNDGRSERYSDHNRDNRYEYNSRDYRNQRGDRYSRYDRNYRDGYVQQNDSRYYRAPQVQYSYSTQSSYGNQNSYGLHSSYGNDQYYRGVRPQHWQRGMHLSNEYRTNRYVVNDWRNHDNLYAPQRGHQWVQNGNNYLLVAIASGIIAQVLLNH